MNSYKSIEKKINLDGNDYKLTFTLTNEEEEKEAIKWLVKCYNYKDNIIYTTTTDFNEIDKNLTYNKLEFILINSTISLQLVKDYCLLQMDYTLNILFIVLKKDTNELQNATLQNKNELNAINEITNIKELETWTKKNFSYFREEISKFKNIIKEFEDNLNVILDNNFKDCNEEKEKEQEKEQEQEQ